MESLSPERRMILASRQSLPQTLAHALAVVSSTLALLGTQTHLELLSLKSWGNHSGHTVEVDPEGISNFRLP